MQGMLGKGVEEEGGKGDATPLMWAVRAGSMEVVNVIRAHLEDQIRKGDRDTMALD
jgi:hypothetical protein